MKIRTLPSLFITGLTLLALSACGSSSSTGSSPSTPATSSNATNGVTAASTDTTGSGGTTPAGSVGATTTAAPKPVTLQVFAGPGIKLDLPEYTSQAGPVHLIYVNRDSQRHTLAVVGSDGKAIGKELEVVRSGDKAEGDYTLAAGSYKLICTVPGHNNMKGTLTVS